LKYFAKLALGSVYFTLKHKFEWNKELEITKDEYDYLNTVIETELVDEGNGLAVKRHAKFTTREEELTVQEKVEEEIQDAPDKLKPNKPGPKPKDSATE
jgi:hypothetical protein